MIEMNKNIAGMIPYNDPSAKGRQKMRGRIPAFIGWRIYL